uniref:Secreted protein n=1 Tax=Glossina palpalis gambiensis TaxID=67801 RepID=A0A1B0AUT7_9MUSC
MFRSSLRLNVLSFTLGSLSFNIGLDSRPVMLCKVNAICLANTTPPSREPAQTQNSARLILHSSAPDVGKRKMSGAGFL